ncbi:hypothetical protein LTR64_001932 [Lithohypha guttulata]|uniref:uncharacterized protein n=1 Tax=Lithohypha guttulata TaxID=1690604 RepID=UPI002DDE59F8|nr:hypothetical protein LTR51_007791 [Lithohypha guttulata]
MSNRPNMLINLPPPPSDPTTPNEQGPGTPNSTTTSLSALSVVAIKDGAMGHGHGGRGTTQSANTLEAERADRISRLAGLERVATVRSTPSGHLIPGAGPAQQQYMKEISTVGSASATGSVGGKTTWASQSMDYDDADKMSEDQEPDDGVSSVGGFSDEDKASLVGFGEGAGSTVSGPVNTAHARAMAARHGINSSVLPRTQSMQGQSASGGSTPMSGVERTVSSTVGGGPDPRMMDGMSYDQGIVDTTDSAPSFIERPYPGSRFSGMGTEVAETVMRDRLDDRDPRGMATPPDNQSLGRFTFEKE